MIDASMRETISTDSLATSIEIKYNTIYMSGHIDNNGTLISSPSQDVNPGSEHTKRIHGKTKTS